MFSEESEGGVRGQEEKVSRLNSFLYPPPNFFSSRSPLRPFLDPSSTGKRVHRLIKELGPCLLLVYLVGP